MLGPWRQSGKSINRVWGRMKAQAGSGHVFRSLLPDLVMGFPTWGLSLVQAFLASPPCPAKGASALQWKDF